MSETINTLPLLVTRGIVIFPGCSVALDVGRSYSINAVNLALSEYEGKIVVTSQVDPMKEDFSFDSIYHIGTLCTISRVRDSKGMLKIRLVGNERVGLVTFNEPANEGACYGCEYTLVPSFSSSEKEEQDLMDNIITTLSTLGNMHFPPSLINTLQKGITAEELTNQLANTFPFSLAEKQNLLVETNIVERLKFILKTLNDVKGIDEVENDINKRVRDKTEKQQKEYRKKAIKDQYKMDFIVMEGVISDMEDRLNNIENGIIGQVVNNINCIAEAYEEAAPTLLEAPKDDLADVNTFYAVVNESEDIKTFYPKSSDIVEVELIDTILEKPSTKKSSKAIKKANKIKKKSTINSIAKTIYESTGYIPVKSLNALMEGGEF